MYICDFWQNDVVNKIIFQIFGLVKTIFFSDKRSTLTERKFEIPSGKCFYCY